MSRQVWHLMVDGSVSDPKLLGEKYLARAVRALGLGLGLSADFVRTFEGSAVGIMTQAHITIHGYDGGFNLDVVSSKPFDQGVLMALVREHFAPNDLNVRTLIRSSGAI